MRKCARYLESVQAGNGGFGYNSAKAKWSLTGAGVLGLQMLGDRQNRDEIEKGIHYILHGGGGDSTWTGRGNLAYGKSGSNLYAWYYNTQACFQHGGKAWDNWNKIFRDTVLDAQKPDGHWNKSAGHTHFDDPVYHTALCTLMLEVYYRYLPATGGAAGGGRTGF